MALIGTQLEKILYKMRSEKDYDTSLEQLELFMELRYERKYDAEVTRDRIYDIKNLTRDNIYDRMCFIERLFKGCEECPMYNYCSTSLYVAVK